jgi:hypothetical protein
VVWLEVDVTDGPARLQRRMAFVSRSINWRGPDHGGVFWLDGSTGFGIHLYNIYPALYTTVIVQLNHHTHVPHIA